MKIAIALCVFLTVAFAGQPLPEALRNARVHRVQGQPLPDALRERQLPKPIHPNSQLVEENAGKIVGGRLAKDGEFPWTISLQRTSHSCGGSIYNERTIITAAHCVDGASASALNVRYGSLKHASGGTRIGVQKVVVHPGYSSSTIDNDIAILHTAVPITLGTNAQPIGLPEQGNDPTGTVTCSGWGTTREGGALPADLMAVDVPIVDRAKCNSQYGSGSITNNMVCAGVDAGGMDACQGDSGGPLVSGSGTSAKLVGIVSWGYGCARPNYAGVYARVGPYVNNFIAQNILN